MVNVDIKQVNIVIEAGADYQMYFVLRDNSNNLIDLTGAVVEAQLREFAEAQDYLQFTATHNGSGGRVSISMPHEDTSAIPYSYGVYDVFITDTNNIREKYITGEVVVVPAVTKPVAGEIIYLLSFASEDDFPSYGMVRRLYFSHATNHMYRWNGTDYVDIVTDGEAATVEVGDVETLPAGSDATVENVGSLLNAVFNFGIPEGNGIASIEKTGTDVLTDTYTVTFTDPNAEAFDFDVTNGNGIVSIAEVVSGLTHTFTVTYNDGDTFAFTMTDGNGIVSVEKTGATDNVDHYRITFDDGTYFDYDVTNVDTSEFYDKDEVDALLADKADVGDSYTKDEEDALLADKADSADLGDLATKDTVDWDSDIDNIPSVFPPEAHNHDDRYYTETEMDSLLADKADADDVYTKDDVDDALAEKANSDDVYTKSATDTLLLDKAPVILNSASGSIASFTDGSASPVTALTVSIDPVQDLHGYDNPWPAGGGKNLLNMSWLSNQTVNGITFTNNDGQITISGTATATTNLNGPIFVLPAGTYSLSGSISNNQLYLYDNDNNVVILESVNGGLNSATISESKNVYLRVRVGSGASVSGIVKPQLESGSSATSYAPYSNVCPISGHSTATVTRTGTNLLNIGEPVQYSNYGLTVTKNTDGTITVIGTSTQNATVVIPITISDMPHSGSIYLHIGNTTTNGQAFIHLMDENNHRLQLKNLNANDLIIDITQACIGKKIGYIGFSAPVDVVVNLTCKPMILTTSTATAYEAPQIQTVTIDLDGTRYGGVLDVLTGTMTVVNATVTFDGSSDETIALQSTAYSKRISIDLPSDTMTWTNGSAVSGKLLSNEFQESYNTATSNGTVGFHYRSSGAKQLIVSLGTTVSWSSVADARVWLAQNPLQVIYWLATPLTVQLSPSQMSALLGENHIWADTGDTAVEYRADTKLFVQGQIAETLDAVKKAKQIITDVTTEMVAPRNLAEGDYVIVGDDLLKTTATVASGGTLTIGTNCVKTTVAEALIALATASE